MVTQLVTIREFLVQFTGNEFVISLILFSWLILGGVGTFLSRFAVPHYLKPTTTILATLSLCLAGLAPLQKITH